MIRAPRGIRRISGLAAVPLVLALGFITAGCGGGSQEEVVSPEDRPPVSEKGKSWGGWRWKGKRQDCFFLYKNRCFDEKAKACKAAGCDEEECSIDDAAPANVSCEADAEEDD